MQRFNDKVVIVTGGGSGIGAATCERFASEGAAVVIAEINSESGRAVAERIAARGQRALFSQTDVADEDSVRRMVSRTVAAWGRIDVLVNNAAVFVFKGVDASVDAWRQVLDVNVMGPALVAKHVVPELRKAGGGAIVNLGSISSFIAQPQFVTYNTSKAAIANMTRCLALDLAPDNIRVNAVCPGTVWTPIVERLTRDAGLDRAAADRDPAWGGSHMIQRIAEPREIAAAIAFLASDDASFITAECLMVDGGYVAK
ncbi:MAG TPA: SDR family oxidoreductase [Planctomycetaceae bacterium]|nr:SDR family oxidoreductase [Planctomycetaceae bacterium]